ncbi:MAG: hypothetical protein LUQ09_01560 [Methanomassiliicoccales archaeon]|nr:hypothetical protein [Methanomassiliicoccales archaeon]
MLSPRQLKDREYIMPAPFVRLMAKGIIGVLKVGTFHLPSMLRMRKISEGEERYVRPARHYELPEYKEGMRTVRSDEKYLRPTLFCDPNDPLIIAMAHELGAFQVPDRVFAERAHHLVKELMFVEEMPIDDAATTLRRGTGACFHLASVLIALCRCAGIKARYKLFAMSMISSWYDSTMGADFLMKKWYDILGYFVLEAEVEMLIDGEWVNGVVGADAAWQASTGLQVSRLGETSLGDWFEAVPGSYMIMESLPLGLATLYATLVSTVPGSFERVNVSLEKQRKNGWRIIEEAGGLEAYDALKRVDKVQMPKVELEQKGSITFD